MGLAAWFKNVQREHERARGIKTCMNGALKAIATGDVEGVRTALQPIPAADLSADQKGKMLKAAIDRGDVKIFGALLAFTGDANAVVTEKTGGTLRTEPFDVYTPLLNYALRVRSHDIALALASDARTSIEQRGDLDTETPLTVAQRIGMSDVAAVLARRTAELRRQEAATWDQVAAELAPGTGREMRRGDHGFARIAS